MVWLLGNSLKVAGTANANRFMVGKGIQKKKLICIKGLPTFNILTNVKVHYKVLRPKTTMYFCPFFPLNTVILDILLNNRRRNKQGCKMTSSAGNVYPHGFKQSSQTLEKHVCVCDCMTFVVPEPCYIHSG